MHFKKRNHPVTRWLFLLIFTFYLTGSALAQVTNNRLALLETKIINPGKLLVESVLPKYYDRQDGLSISELIARAQLSNQELTAARLEIEKAKARLQQARLRPNPTLEFEQQSGRTVGNGGDWQFTVGASLPVEIYGRRDARINVANMAIEAGLAEIRNRECLLAANILINYAETLAALRELETLENVLELDLRTTAFVQIRVNEGDAAPLELNLLQAEIERLRARRQLSEGRLQSSLTQLKLLAGIDFNEPLKIREQITNAVLPNLAPSPQTAIEMALKERPDVRLAQIEEQAATAGLRLIRAQSKPDLTAYTRYSQGRSVISTVDGNFPQRDRSLTFGVAVGIPIFNKNQGALTEAELAIKQAQARREFSEQMVKGEILAAYQRYESANRAVMTLQTSALPRSNQNVETFRRVYELGEIKITDLIAEQRRFLDMTRDLTEALTIRYRAQADLNVALGGGALLPAQK